MTADDYQTADRIIRTAIEGATGARDLVELRRLEEMERDIHRTLRDLEK